MSGPVDVLAIGVVAAIDNCAYYLREEAGLAAAAEQMEASSAAVAELIEAAGCRVEWVNGSWYATTATGHALSSVPRDEAGARKEVADHLAAALARVQGGQL